MADRMKVLFLTNLPAPYRVEFFNRLGEMCDLTVLFERTLSSNRDGKWKSEERHTFKSIFMDGFNVGKEDALCLEVMRYLKTIRFDFFVICGYSTPTSILSIYYCRHKKIPYILSIDGARNIQESRIVKVIKSRLIKGAIAYLCTGKEPKEMLVKHGASITNTYIYPFSSLSEKEIDKKIGSKEDKEQLRKELGIREERVIVSVGQYIFRKGFDILLKALSNERNDVGVYIIGGKEPTQEYIDIIKERRLKNVHFVDFQKKNELIKYYHGADLFVLPTRDDIWGLVINEAMACGLPVITTNQCVAGSELIKPFENGFLVDCEDVENLSEKINYLLDDEEGRKIMAQNNIQKMKGYSLEKMATEHYKIFMHLKDGRKEYQI